MLPVLFRIGPIEIPSFGFALALGIVLAWLYFMKEFGPENKEAVTSLLTYSVLAGMLGARLNFMIEHLEEITSWKDFFSVLLSRSGLTFYGGILSGILIAYLYSRKKGLPLLRILDAGAPAICIGYFFGRLGCQLAGDGDYGIASHLPWAMSYPQGTVPTLERVHPTPVYEMILYGLVFILLLKLKKRNWQKGIMFSVFLILAGLERFLIELIRTNPRVFLRLTEAQVVSLILVVAGVFVMAILNFHNTILVRSNQSKTPQLEQT